MRIRNPALPHHSCPGDRQPDRAGVRYQATGPQELPTHGLNRTLRGILALILDHVHVQNGVHGN